MITSKQDYLQNLHLIYNQNFPSYVQVDTDEFIYNIDVSSRQIEAPTFLGVTEDHKAETVYFKIDRFVDYMDLASTACIIYYQNAAGESGIYIPQFYDIFTYELDHKMIIPWHLTDHVAAKEGNVMFSIRFFKTALDLIPGEPSADPKIIYELNFLPSTSKILKGITLKENTGIKDEGKPATWYEEMWDQIKTLSDRQTLRWAIIK